MRHRSSWVLLKRQAAYIAAATIFIAALGLLTASAATYSIIYVFPGLPNGWGPSGPLVMDAAGNLYGTTSYGGTVVPFQPFGCGTVFELSPPPTSSGAWTERLLHAFQGGADGCFSEGGLAVDQDGNLYGTTGSGGQITQCSGSGCGTVFKLTPPAIVGGEWGYGVIYRFSGGPKDGSLPDQLTIGSNGVIYGTTRLGPTSSLSYYGGTVFQLNLQGSRFVETTVHEFGLTRNDGVAPGGGVTPDPTGNLFGSAAFGGLYGFGAVYELTPPTSPGGPWPESLLRSFPQILNFFDQGAVNPSRIIIDKNGDLFGTTVYEGSKTHCAYGCGTVFRLTHPAQQGGQWAISILYGFPHYGDGSGPNALYLDLASGSLFGTVGITSFNNGAGCGAYFHLTPPITASGAWNYSILHTFVGGSDGCGPGGNIVRDSAGNYFGVTSLGGMANANNGYGYGTVFEITP